MPSEAKTSDAPLRSDSVGRRPGKHPSPTSDIEHAISRSHPCGIDQLRPPLTKNGRDKTLLVDFGRVPRYLPAFVFRHRLPLRVRTPVALALYFRRQLKFGHG